MCVSLYILPVPTIVFLTSLFLISNQYTPSSLQNNVLINGDFSQPVLDPGLTTLLFSNFIPGWQCSHMCQVDNCKNRHVAQLSTNKVFANCSGQILDLNSDGTIEVVSQFASLKVGRYQFSFEYNIPVQEANKKTLFVYFNEKLVFQRSPNVQYQFFTYSFVQEVLSRDGKNNITFTMNSSAVDQIGFRIKNVKLERVYDPEFQRLLNYSLLNSVITTIVSFPGVRGILGQFVNFFVNMQKLQFYGLHNRNYSSNSLLLLHDAKDLMDLKGSLFQELLAAISIFSSVDNQLAGCLDYKLSYSEIRNPNSGNAAGFMDTNAGMFVYSLPICLLTLMLSKVLFVMLYRWPASRFFRKFSFTGILLIMFCEGNVQQLTFYVFGQLLSFFSLAPTHKFINAAVVLFYFTIFLTAVGSVWWFRYHYRKNAKYFMQESKLNLKSLWSYTAERGFICISCGVTHQILMSQPNIQLIVLIIIEFIWVGLKCYFFIYGIYRHKIIAIVSVIESCIRISFQVVCYIYANQEQKKLFINEVVMPVIIYCFLGIWFSQIMFSMGNVQQISTKISKNCIIPININGVKNKDESIKPEIEICNVKNLKSTKNKSPRAGKTLVRQSFLFNDYLKQQNPFKPFKINISKRIAGSKSNPTSRSKALSSTEQVSPSNQQESQRRYFLRSKQPIDLIYS